MTHARNFKIRGSIIFLIISGCVGIMDNPVNDLQVTIPGRVSMVYPMLDTENSRWFYFDSASRPFGMVNLSPDTQTDGAWGSGYRYLTDTIKGFSHVHGWQTSGISVMPVIVTPSTTRAIFEDFHSPFSHQNEVVFPGYHQVKLERFGIKAELAGSKRVGMHRYTFPDRDKPAVLFNLNTVLGPSENQNGKIEQTSSTSLAGSVQMAPTHRRPKPFTLFFQVIFNAEIDSLVRNLNTGNILVYTRPNQKELLMKVALSYTSVQNAGLNHMAELPHWDFDKVVQESVNEWDELLGRIRISGGTTSEQRRFYTDLWHALQGRRIISDVNGAYPDNTGNQFRIGQLPVGKDQKPLFNHYNSDSFWGAQWTLNTLWGLVYPDIYKEFVHSLLQYYRDGGFIPRGPSGGNYTYVMTGAATTPFIVSAIQKGIIKSDLDSIFEGLKKNHLPGGLMSRAGYEHNTLLGGGLSHYMEKGFVPYPIPEGKFGSHQDGASLSLEYAYQDWTLAQLAKRLGKESDYDYFMERSLNYRHVFDTVTGFMRPKDVFGNWQADFDPYRYENGFNESNAAQATWFVPHDINGLASLMGGKAAAIEKLYRQFQVAELQGFTSGTSHEKEMHPEYSRIPINYGNQPSIQTAFIFSELGRPELTQYWSRKVIDRVFGGLSPNTGYNGDEDQGLMGSLSVLLKMGLFQLNGGTENDPVYQIGSPMFDRIEIELHPAYYSGKIFVIENTRNNPEDFRIEIMRINDKPHNVFTIKHSQISSGGKLKLNFTSK